MQQSDVTGRVTATEIVDGIFTLALEDMSAPVKGLLTDMKLPLDRRDEFQLAIVRISETLSNKFAYAADYAFYEERHMKHGSVFPYAKLFFQGLYNKNGSISSIDARSALFSLREFVVDWQDHAATLMHPLRLPQRHGTCLFSVLENCGIVADDTIHSATQLNQTALNALSKRLGFVMWFCFEPPFHHMNHVAYIGSMNGLMNSASTITTPGGDKIKGRMYVGSVKKFFSPKVNPQFDYNFFAGPSSPVNADKKEDLHADDDDISMAASSTYNIDVYAPTILGMRARILEICGSTTAGRTPFAKIVHALEAGAVAMGARFAYFVMQMRDSQSSSMSAVLYPGQLTFSARTLFNLSWPGVEEKWSKLLDYAAWHEAALTLLTDMAVACSGTACGDPRAFVSSLHGVDVTVVLCRRPPAAESRAAEYRKLYFGPSPKPAMTPGEIDRLKRWLLAPANADLLWLLELATSGRGVGSVLAGPCTQPTVVAACVCGSNCTTITV